MTDREGHEETDVDPGEPIRELAALREQPTKDFLDRIQDAIHRRDLASNVIDFSIRAFVSFVAEIILIGSQLFGGADKDEEEPRG